MQDIFAATGIMNPANQLAQLCMGQIRTCGSKIS